MKPLLTIFITLISILPLAGSASVIPDRQLLELDEAIRNAPRYTSAKTAKLDSMRRTLEHIPKSDIVAKTKLTLDIADQYRPYNTDSAVFYSRMAADMAAAHPASADSVNSRMSFLCEISLLNSLSTAGIFSAANKIYEDLKAADLPIDSKIEFWKSARQMFYYMKAYVSDESPFHADYEKSFLAYDDSLINHLPHTSVLYRYLSAEKLVRTGRLREAEASLLKLLEGLSQADNFYGMTTFQLSEVYKKRNNDILYAKYLTEAAISDIMVCAREGLALPTLAQWLYTEGYTNEAFKYINFALSEATSGNARMRMVAIASSMPMIDTAYRERISETNRQLTISVILITIVTVNTIILIIILIRLIRRSRRINEKLRASSSIQQNYIGHYIALCASYAGKLDSLTQLVSRKIKAGQGDDLLRLVKSGRFAESPNDDFYALFDKAFLDIFPDFIEDINTLLAEDKRYPAGSQTLTPDLRIYALVRLGISESTRISQVLHYSVSTVYTYRNRMRNRAINRDTFEADILKLSRHSEQQKG